MGNEKSSASRATSAVVKDVGKRIRQRREALGLTLRQLEARTEIDNSKLARIENETSNGGMTVASFKTICEKLLMSPTWALLGVGPIELAAATRTTKSRTTRRAAAHV